MLMHLAHPRLWVFLSLACLLSWAPIRAAEKSGKASAEARSESQNEAEEAVPDDSRAKPTRASAKPAKAAAFKVSGKGAEATQTFEKDPLLELTDPRTYRLKVVIRVTSPAEGDSQNVVVVAPIPMDWPEQQIRLLEEKYSEGGKIEYHVKPGQCKTFRYTIPEIEAGKSASVELLYEITRWRMEFAADPEELALPQGLPAEVRDQFVGSSTWPATLRNSIATKAPGRRSKAFGVGPATTSTSRTAISAGRCSPSSRAAAIARK
jgi:hypothetical protein